MKRDTDLFGEALPMSRGEEKRACKDAIYAYCKERYLSYGAMGVRSIFYAMVGQGVVEKTDRACNRIGVYLTEMRERGELPWGWIEDNTRKVVGFKEFDGVSRQGSHRSQLTQAIRSTVSHGLWTGQKNRVLIWIEKDGLSSLFEHAIDEVCPRGVEFLAGKGQCSVTVKNNVARNIAYDIRDGFNTHLYYFGDFDEAGRKIWESETGNALTAKLRRYVERHLEAPPGDALRMEWRAVTEEQIAELNLPTRPEKNKKSKHAEAVELDTVPPDFLTALVQDCIRASIDLDSIAKAHARNREEDKKLTELRARIADFCDELESEGFNME